MKQLVRTIEEAFMSLTGPKQNQHYIDMDGYKVFYEKLGSKR